MSGIEGKQAAAPQSMQTTARSGARKVNASDAGDVFTQVDGTASIGATSKPPGRIPRKARTDRFTPDAWIREHGAHVFRLLSDHSASQQPLGVDTLRQSEARLSFRFRIGAALYFVKAFDLSRPASRGAFARELGAAQVFAESDLIARPLGWNEEKAFVAFDFERGRSVSDLLDQHNAVCLARSMGDWYAALSAYAPTQQVETTWLDYLSRYPELRSRLNDGQVRTALAGMPIDRLSLCRNDAHPSNFILADDDRLIGVDFEAAAMKPEGWDLLLAARYLGRRYPQQIAPITAALAEGWGGGIGLVSQRRLLWLLRVFAEAFVFTDPDFSATRVSQGAQPDAQTDGQLAARG